MLYAKKNQVSRLLKQRAKLKAVLPDEVAEVYRVWVANNAILKDNRGEEPEWTSNWAQKFIKSWNLKYHKMKGEAVSVSWDEIKEQVHIKDGADL
ncbi:hypothetical protein BGZ65_002041 [Modicella reniformis]|uniref:Uncharacterized protein n=1 Tax=Modicella reniformis TaxID=1440133 RepID=A0A9P6LZP2_9FUNG|nr:hypothetical protein BGZ65_002041 [Modicella reniformis]